MGHVKREDGFNQNTSTSYMTIGQSEGRFEKITKGTVEFGKGESRKEIKINLEEGNSANFQFEVQLKGASFGALLENDVCTVHVVERDKIHAAISKHRNRQKKWIEQFKQALDPTGGEENGKSVGVIQLVLHVLTLPWKLF